METVFVRPQVAKSVSRTMADRRGPPAPTFVSACGSTASVTASCSDEVPYEKLDRALGLPLRHDNRFTCGIPGARAVSGRVECEGPGWDERVHPLRSRSRRLQR